MPLLPPGSAKPMPSSSATPEMDNIPPPPPKRSSSIPPPPPASGAQKTGAPPPPPPVSKAIHQPIEDERPGNTEDDDDANVTVLKSSRSSPLPWERGEAPPPPQEEEEAEVVMTDPVPDDDDGEVAMPAVAPRTAPVAHAGSNMPAGTSSNKAKVIQDLAAAGFEGLDIGFASFPIVRLQDRTFSTNDDESLGSEFLCVIHASRTKWLLKKEDDNNTSDFVYSFDQEITTAGKSIQEVMDDWAAEGYTQPVWKRYLDVTAQLYDGHRRQLTDLVILSVPYNSVPRLTGYLATIKMGQGLEPQQVVTHVLLGPKVTNAKKPFFPWAFKMYCTLDRAL